MMDEASRSEDEPGDEQDDSQPESAPSLPSSTREIRNKAEKQRRDKLNQFINELAMLVPMVSSSAKRLDKTSILRLSATFLRMHQVLLKRDTSTEQLRLPIEWCQSLLEGMDGILLVVTASGKIVFVTHNVETILGHPQTDLLGQSLYNITSLEDHEELKRALKSDAESNLPSTLDAASSSLVTETKRQPERRSFYLRLRQKSVSKSDQPQFELVHVMGHLRVPPPSSQTKKNRTDTHISNEAILVAMMKPFKEKRVTENSLIEATREEWVSRHLIDGTIVFSDHRISVVSGYMSDEVTGIHGFRYMHQDDVRWVMIALRQMYYRGESYGSSCYRLMSKNGEFIYIRTHGYLELNEDTNSVQSFICINTLVSQEEGEAQIAAMKSLYTPLVTQGDNLVSGIADPRYLKNVQDSGNGSSLLQPLMVDNPTELKTAIEQLLSNLPSDQIHPSSNDPAPDYQFAKAAMVSRTMPPVTVHTSKMGVQRMPMIKKGPRYTRPSVITRAKEKRVITEDDSTVVKRHRLETSVITMADTSRSVIRAREEYVEGDPGSSILRETSFIPVAEPNSPPQPVYIASPQESSLPLQGASYELSPDNRLVIPTQPSEILFSNDLLNIEDRETFINISGELDETLQVPTVALWESDISTLEEGVSRGQSHLEDRIQYQGTQIQAIEEDLTSVQFESGGQMRFSTLSQLKAEYEKQHKLLKTLQQDHQNIQNCKEQVPICGAQDINV
ncbi:aryl hydrocarbon receptor nuclear translocator-like protein 1 isoform X2 [Cimex lectularius]|uniref:Uncharacterized protein n=1 Tax=Cimex lectularius TaxID=79782 RepID=A0A8I6TMT1_CIMLE|nr:aryl hydrocarbon receptor nuclear translocator-like protein 1 isoform X2 [Cimex lectularius]